MIEDHQSVKMRRGGGVVVSGSIQAAM